MTFYSDLPDMAALPSERLVARYFNFDSTEPPVIVQGVTTRFAVVQPGLFYESKGEGRVQENAFPGVFLPCAGYGKVSMHDETTLIDLVCKPRPPKCAKEAGADVRAAPAAVDAGESSSAAAAVFNYSLAAKRTAQRQRGAQRGWAMRSPPSSVVDFSSAQSESMDSAPAHSCSTTTTPDSQVPKRLSLISLRFKDDPESTPSLPEAVEPGYFIGAVMDECKHRFASCAKNIRIARNFLNRFAVYDQLVLSALMTEHSNYREDTHLNSETVNVVFDIVKRSIAVQEGDTFKLKSRGYNIKESRWSIVCCDEMTSSVLPLPTPMRVHNDFFDAMSTDDIFATDVRRDLLKRQYAIASAMTLMVYPYFDHDASESTKLQASNEIFHAAGFSATPTYCDPIIRTASVCAVFSNLLKVLKRSRVQAEDYASFIEACEMLYCHKG